MFSDRTAWRLTDNAWAAAVGRRRSSGAPLLDLTESNPTRCGFDYSGAGLAALSDPAGALYSPEPRGLGGAREAVAAYYAGHGRVVDPVSVVLTASTSEAYSYLFKLLADPGDAVLAPAPSYPLFEYLAGLDGVRLVDYPLRYDGAWSPDFPALEAALPDRARALIVVHPHNPTGAFLKGDELARLTGFCRAHNLALISDEVFLDYAYAAAPERAPSLAGDGGVLTFALSGLSKLAGLPQVKASWLTVGGPPDLRDEALARLDVIADTYLSVSTPVQLALPILLANGARLRTQILDRVITNRRLLDGLLAGPLPLHALPAEGGWYAALRLPATLSEEAWALALLEDGVLVHPGYFFDLSGCFVVISLLPTPEVFAEGVRRLVARVVRG
ncbi:MAG: pyridoxal phosphate-dependent aminotransferase [Chloroflexia bacterium]